MSISANTVNHKCRVIPIWRRLAVQVRKQLSRTRTRYSCIIYKGRKCFTTQIPHVNIMTLIIVWDENYTSPYFVYLLLATSLCVQSMLSLVPLTTVVWWRFRWFIVVHDVLQQQATLWIHHQYCTKAIFPSSICQHFYNKGVGPCLLLRAWRPNKFYLPGSLIYTLFSHSYCKYIIAFLCGYYYYLQIFYVSYDSSHAE